MMQQNMAHTSKHTFCRICEAACGLRVDLDQHGTVLDIAPNEQHIASKGYACLKGLKAHEFRDSPDRITQPMKRVNGQLQAISWEQALSEIGGTLKRLAAAHGGDAIGLYLGNPISMSFIPPVLSDAFVKAFGSSKLYHTGSQDCNNKFVVAERMYGCAQIQPFPGYRPHALYDCGRFQPGHLQDVLYQHAALGQALQSAGCARRQGDLAQSPGARRPPNRWASTTLSAPIPTCFSCWRSCTR